MISPKHPTQLAQTSLPEACELLAQGKILIYPTETVYGLGVDVNQAAALESLFALKARDKHKAISVLIGKTEQITELTREISPLAQRLIDAFWPGPLTLVLPAAAHLNPLLHASSGWIGIRRSSHPLAQALAEAYGRPITTTSANPSGAPSAIKIAQLQNYFASFRDIYYLDGGDLASSIGSTVLRVEGEKIVLLREGEISRASLERIAYG